MTPLTLPAALVCSFLGQALTSVRPSAEPLGLGAAICVLDDLDGDGVRDLALGRSRSGNIFGELPSVAVVSGKTAAVLWTRQAPEWWHDGFGATLAALDDLDGDGFGELFVGAPTELGDPSRTDNFVWVLAGIDGRRLLELRGNQVSKRGGGNDQFGASACRAGDLDGDDIGDLWVGASIAYSEAGDRLGLGSIRAFSGATGAPLHRFDARDSQVTGKFLVPWSDLDGDGLNEVVSAGCWEESWLHLHSGADGSPIYSIRPSLSHITSLVKLGDVDGDGHPDLALGGVGSDRKGITVLVNGKTGVEFAHLTPERADLHKGPFGYALAALPDLDWDGVGELALSTPYHRGRGRVTVRSPISGETLLEFDGEQVSGSFGTALAAADLDGDGAVELIVGQPGDWHGDPNGPAFGGAVHTLSPVPSSRHLTWVSAVDVPLAVVPRWRAVGDVSVELGTWLCVLGDIDGDRRLDLAAGGPWSVVALSGTGRERWRREGNPFARGLRALTTVGDLDDDGLRDLGAGYPRQPGHTGGPTSRAWLLSARDGRLLREIRGSPEPELRPSEHLGWSLVDAGDLDGDGSADVWIGAPFGPAPDGPGRLFAFSSMTGEELLHLDAPNGLRFGEVAASLGDLNGDGVRDLLVGGSWASETWIHAVSGADLELIYAEQLDVRGGFRLTLAPVGDIDGDGTGDVALGARAGAGDTNGVVLLLSGCSGVELTRLSGPERSLFGTSICGLPDLDGDGTPEFAIGAPAYRATGIPGWPDAPGRVSVHSGASGTVLSTIAGTRAGTRFGAALAAADLDGDGSPELIIGEPEWCSPAEDCGDDQRGAVHVVSLHWR